MTQHDPARSWFTVDVPREQGDRFGQLATEEHRTNRQQLRVLIERYIAEHAPAEQHQQAA